MENKERRIKDLEKKIELSEAAVDHLYENIGEILYAEAEDKKSGSIAAEIFAKMADIDNESRTERERISDILTAIERTDEIEALRKNLLEKIRSIEKDNISNYETIGRASFEAFKSGELPEEKYAGIFGEIMKTLLKIENSEEERELLGSRAGKSVLNRIKSGARNLYLRNITLGYYKQLQRQYKKAGKQICHSELVMNLEAESVEKALKPFRENMEGLEKLEKEEAALTSENEKLKGNLEGLGVQTSALKTVNGIESHINELYENRKLLQREAGKLIFLNRKDALAKTAGIKSVLKEIDKENNNISGLGEEIQRHEAEMEIERKNREIETLNKKINGYEEKISSYSQEAEQLKDKIQAAEENIKKLEDAASKNGEEKNG